MIEAHDIAYARSGVPANLTASLHNLLVEQNEAIKKMAEQIHQMHKDQEESKAYNPEPVGQYTDIAQKATLIYLQSRFYVGESALHENRTEWEQLITASIIIQLLNE